MRFRATFFTHLFVVVLLALPTVAQAAAIPFFGPIIPPENSRCTAGWGMLITVINNIIRFLITIAIVFIAPLMVAYSGFLFVVNPVNSEGIKKAKGILTNTIVGIVIALAGWMIVDAIMATLYAGSEGSTRWGTWSQLITSGGASQCITLASSLNQAIPGVNITGVDASGGQFLSLPNSGDCSASNLLTVVAGGPYSLSQTEANTLSCLAVPESRCGTRTTGARQANGTPTSASGMFQIILGLNDTCHNLNIPSCTAAARQAGYTVSDTLNCSTAFRGGSPRSDMTNLSSACIAASANLSCNVQAAACLVRARQGGFGDWTGTGDGYAHATQRNCVTQYANLR